LVGIRHAPHPYLQSLDNLCNRLVRAIEHSKHVRFDTSSVWYSNSRSGVNIPVESASHRRWWKSSYKGHATRMVMQRSVSHALLGRVPLSIAILVRVLLLSLHVRRCLLLLRTCTGHRARVGYPMQTTPRMHEPIHESVIRQLCTPTAIDTLNNTPPL
jgi:hypothetical protein